MSNPRNGDPRDDEQIVRAAVAQNPMALEFASYRLRGERDIIEIAITRKGTALKFAREPQREDLLRLANLWSIKDPNLPALVESVKFSLTPETSPAASNLHIFLREHDFFKQFYIYTPNQVCKDWCRAKTDDPEYNRVTDETCECVGGGFGKSCWPQDDKKHPMNKNTCWRFSFRQHLVQARDTKGFMLQLEEGRELGAGQKIEKSMAEQVGVEVLKVEVDPEFDPHKFECDKVIIEDLIKRIQENQRINSY